MEEKVNDVQFLRPIAEIYADLKKDIPARLIETKDTGKFTADFVPHYTIRDMLDHFAPGWEWTETPHLFDGKIYLTGALTIVGLDEDGNVTKHTREATGNEDSTVGGFGDPSSNASAQALRRAAMSHGLGRNLWKK